MAEDISKSEAMPDWYHQVANGPGATLTDMFDKARRSLD